MKSYNGMEADKHHRIQIEINSHKVVPVNFKKTEQDKIDLMNAKVAYKSIKKDSERFENYRTELIRSIVNSPSPDFNLVVKPIR